MANREAWCADKLSKLLNEDLRMSTLTEIKEHFSAISQDEANETANLLQLPMVFDCLNDSKSEQIDLACEVLSLCMSSLSLGQSTNQYGPSLERALSHPSANVKIMALKEIFRTASNPELVLQLSKQVPLITALIVCVGDDEIAVAKKAADILVLIGKTKDGIRQLMCSQQREVFSQTIAISDVVRFRVYEIVVNIARDSKDSLQSLVQSGLIFSLISELDNDDVLLKLNVLELLSDLGTSEHGLSFLDIQGVIQKISLTLTTVNEDPLANLILPGLLKFFGKVAHWKPMETQCQYPDAFNILLEVINAGDLSTLGVAYDTLGHIASTSIGKCALQKLEQRLFSTLKIIGTQLAMLPTELRVRGINCIENMIRVDLKDQNNNICSLVQSWFSALCDEPLNMFVKYAQNPFIEIRCAGLGVLHALSEQQWGQELIKNCPGLIEFLLDRRIEPVKESKEIKYAIVKALSTSTTFSENTLLQLQQFVREGPFYVQAVTEVAIEGSS